MSKLVMDQWRDNNKVDIFDLIKKMIKQAATDRPADFCVKRGDIAEMLYSCDLIHPDKKLQVAPASEGENLVGQEKGQKQEVPTSRPNRSLKVIIKLKKAKTDSGKHDDEIAAKAPLTPAPQKDGITTNVAAKNMVSGEIPNNNNVSATANNQQNSVTGHQIRKPLDLDVKARDKNSPAGTDFEKKLEASRMKMQRTYKELECIKKKRKIQVLYLHQLPQQDHCVKRVNKRFKLH